MDWYLQLALQILQDAFAAMRIAEKKFMCVSRSRILLVKLQVLHECALHRCDDLLHRRGLWFKSRMALKAYTRWIDSSEFTLVSFSIHRLEDYFGDQFCDALGVLASCVSGMDMELKMEASLRHARTLLSANQTLLKYSPNLCPLCPHATLKLQYFYELGRVKMGMGSNLWRWDDSSVCHCPLRTWCEEMAKDRQDMKARMNLGDILLSVLISLNERGLWKPPKAAAVAHSLFSTCYKFNLQVKNATVLLLLAEIHKYNELAAEAFYLMAIVYNKLGQVDEREEAASAFRKHITAFENPEDLDDSVYRTL
ncbi:UNVERIFIED_CONTAM: Anaphase-promoting complex subunit 5 [Sesamum indicum]